MSSQFEQCVVSVTKRAIGVLDNNAPDGSPRDNIKAYVMEGLREVLGAMPAPSHLDETELLRAVCKAALRKMRDDGVGSPAH